MKLTEITAQRLRSAVDLYLQLAYPHGLPSRVKLPSALDTSDDVDEILSGFLNETRTSGPIPVRRFALRLGNEQYPFMKLVLQEYLLADEFVFVVDTHDDMDIKPNYPDYERWQALRESNAKLRERIEATWREADLDTCLRLRARAEELAARRMCRMKGLKAVVVDDQVDLAETFAAVLRADGYEVSTAHDGRKGFDLIAAVKPDLVLTDFEMLQMDGLELIRRMRESPELRSIPVILATGSNLTLEQMRQATGFLSKPFAADVLVSMADELLRKRTGGANGAATASS